MAFRVDGVSASYSQWQRSYATVDAAWASWVPVVSVVCVEQVFHGADVGVGCAAVVVLRQASDHRSTLLLILLVTLAGEPVSGCTLGSGLGRLGHQSS